LFAIQDYKVGPLVYAAAVIHNMQQVGTVAARLIVIVMGKLHNNDNPGRRCQSVDKYFI